MTTITIHELTGERRSWTSTHSRANESTAIVRAIRRHFGRSHGFRHEPGLPAGYGSIVRHLSRRERGSGSTWAAEVVIGRVRIDVEG